MSMKLIKNLICIFYIYKNNKRKAGFVKQQIPRKIAISKLEGSTKKGRG
jgi:hypothetical protein